MKVGDIYEIRNRRRNCNGIPFIRIERIDATGEVWVSDWDTPQKRAYRPPLACGYTFPDVRRFAGADDFAKRIRYWKRLPPNAAMEGRLISAGRLSGWLQVESASILGDGSE